jgi:hypothetical protein
VFQRAAKFVFWGGFVLGGIAGFILGLIVG